MMKKIVSSAFLLLAVLSFSFWGVFPQPLLAAETDTVTATVTAVVVSVSVADGNVAFGAVDQDSTQDTTTNGVNDSQTATNDGSVDLDFSIKAADTASWTLGETAGEETYTLDFCTSDCDGNPTWTSVGIDSTYVTLATSVAKDGTQEFDLQVGTPTTTTVVDEQSITVTVQASASAS